MRTSFVVPALAAVVAFGAFVTLSTPARATTLDQAIKLCEKNPRCSRPHDMDRTFCIDDCEHAVECSNPKKCRVLYNRPGGNPKPTRGNVGTVLTGAGGHRTGVKGTGVTTVQGGPSHATFNKQSATPPRSGGHHR
jgi:hypothetical protein